MAKIRKNMFEDWKISLFKKFTKVWTRNIPVNGPVLKEKKQQKLRLNWELTDSQLQMVRLDRFKNKHNLFYKSIFGESVGVDSETVQELLEETLPS